MKTKNIISSSDSIQEDIASNESTQSTSKKKKSKKCNDNILSQDIFEISSDSDFQVKKKRKKHRNNNEETENAIQIDSSIQEDIALNESTESTSRKKKSKKCKGNILSQDISEISSDSNFQVEKKKKKHKNNNEETENAIQIDSSIQEDIALNESIESTSRKKKSKKFKENILSQDIFEISSDSDFQVKKKKKHRNKNEGIQIDNSIQEDISSKENTPSINTNKKSKKCEENSLSQVIFELQSDEFTVKKKNKNEGEETHSYKDANLEETDNSIQIDEVKVKKRKKYSDDNSDKSSPHCEFKIKKKHEITTKEIDIGSLPDVCSRITEEISAIDENLTVGKRKRHDDEPLSETQFKVKKIKKKHRSQDYVNTSNESCTEIKDENLETDVSKIEDGKKKKKSKKHKNTENVNTEDVSNESSYIDELNSQKKCKMPAISDSALNNLLLQMDQISKENEKKHSVEKPEVKIRPQLFGESPSIAESQKSEKMPSISDSALNNLLLKMNQISKENEEMCSVEKSTAKSKTIKEDQIEHLSVESMNERSSENEDSDTTQSESMNTADDRNIDYSSKKDSSNVKKTVEKDIDYKKLMNMVFELPWKLSEIHKIACNPGGKPTKEQRRQLAKAGIKIKTGKYTKEEDEKIRQNWRKFCRLHDWDEKVVDPFLKGSVRSFKGCLSVPQFQTFVKFLSHNFEDRAMIYIYSRFVRLYSDVELENFTPEEDEIITNYIKTNTESNPFAHLAVKLNRSIESVTKRRRKLMEEKMFDYNRITWNESLTRDLLLIMVKVTDCKNLSNLRDRSIESKEWKQIASEILIPPEKLKRVWNHVLYTRIFHPNFQEEYNFIKHDIIERFYTKYKDWREIDWTEEAKNYDCFTRLRLYKLFHDLVKQKVPPEKRKDFRACLEYLRERPLSSRPGKFSFINRLLSEFEEDPS